jgi:chorismate dehydratase
MYKVKVSVVSYLNSKPFVYGLQHADLTDVMELSEDIPSDCAQKLIDKKADIGLIPVAMIPMIENAQIISDYCIGAKGEVNSVFLLSNTPVTSIRKIYLDKHSRTSNNLAKVLAKNLWKISPEYIAREEDLIELGNADGMVLIGDRTFGVKNNYQYVYDLSLEWEKLTGLPFVFAAWVSNRTLDQEFLSRFNAALDLGMKNRDIVIRENPRPDFDVEDYLLRKLDYRLDEEKRKAIALFLNMVTEL